MYSYLQFDTFQKTSYSTLSENFFGGFSRTTVHRHRELKQKKTLIGQVSWAVKFYKESSIEEDEACIGRSGIFDSRVSKKAGRAWTLTAEFGRKQVGHALWQQSLEESRSGMHFWQQSSEESRSVRWCEACQLRFVDDYCLLKGI